MNGGVNATEPRGDMGREGDLDAEAVANLLLVNVVRQAVGHEVVGQERNIVLGRGLSASARVTRDAEDAGDAAKVLNQGGDAELRRRRVAARVGDQVGLVDVRPLGDLGQSVRPGLIEAVVGSAGRRT